MEDIKNRIEIEVKDTVGYNEAANKDSFMVGVSTALSKAEIYYERQIKELIRSSKSYKSMYENIHSDIKSLTSIISKYSDEN